MWDIKKIELDEISKIIFQAKTMVKLKSVDINKRYIFTIKDIDLTYILTAPNLVATVEQYPNIEFTSFAIGQMVK